MLQPTTYNIDMQPGSVNRKKVLGVVADVSGFAAGMSRVTKKIVLASQAESVTFSTISLLARSMLLYISLAQVRNA